MMRNLMALPCMLALVLACGQGRTDDQNTGAAGAGAESGALPADTSYTGGGVEDTTATPANDTTFSDSTAAGATGADAPSDTTY